ncbi:hypothetical protein C0W38_00435 [Photobacterium angustum]|uniref:hypothetical protein n=1 Tax=Photobacterium angustum TaxID=661 RepID=UPI000D17E6DB|nr:hypothetical protein [Photobacterium angustum]PSW94777.1 hypothetical protein C0W79_12280 [Photobacterium angustum]PSX04509.1 hypothetical protein C0W87_01340 [Photobacterium angustum]PSX37640.1 hypothetical protein C0W38_00435 [Photobacterium angustum]
MDKKTFKLFTLLGLSVILGLHFFEITTNESQSFSIAYFMFEWLPLYLAWGGVFAIGYCQWKRNTPRKNNKSRPSITH